MIYLTRKVIQKSILLKHWAKIIREPKQKQKIEIVNNDIWLNIYYY